MGHSWNFKFKDFTGDHFYHLEELVIEENNPVEQHNKLISQLRSSDDEGRELRPSNYVPSDMAQHQQIDMTYGIEEVYDNDEIFDRRSIDTPKFTEQAHHPVVKIF